MLLIKGARSFTLRPEDKSDPVNIWVQDLMPRMHLNVVAVALANKTTRAAWAVVHNSNEYHPELLAAALPLPKISEEESIPAKKVE
tara:strand:+ start:1727 stop:1984 length:258 start_codon:yes stop_codon:yes gene_type:complete